MVERNEEGETRVVSVELIKGAETTGVPFPHDTFWGRWSNWRARYRFWVVDTFAAQCTQRILQSGMRIDGVGEEEIYVKSTSITHC